MKIFTPTIRAYRRCGFHNRTIKELRQNPGLCRDAILDPQDAHIAHVPNIFGNFQDRGITYHTTLTIVGIEEPSESVLSERSRGVSLIEVTDVSETSKLWRFKILIPKRYCCEDLCPSGEGADLNKFCMALCHRTDIFAMEFLCCYRFFVEQVLETYEKGNCEVREPVRDHDLEQHPKKEEADALICTYHGVARHLEWFQKTYPEQNWKFDSIQQFLELHLARNRKAMLPYYLKWLREHRVRLELVERKTMEYISMSFLDCEHEN